MSSNENHSPGFGIYFLVWFALLILTGLTVAVAGIKFGALTIATALTVASVKSYLVLTIFMHLKVESRIFKVFVWLALFFLIVSFVLLFSDYTFWQIGD
ncbi:MAG TPA: cytochrome C oxidase subunit IV family protein [Ignavibacteriaceae bacterium]|nr:cytochrome C oxidase subunit IV family protein [Ignavibacteriaceae bacterium]